LYLFTAEDFLFLGIVLNGRGKGRFKIIRIDEDESPDDVCVYTVSIEKGYNHQPPNWFHWRFVLAEPKVELTKVQEIAERRKQLGYKF